jgi:hypothetical protein
MPYAESLGVLNQPRIRLRQGYGVTGHADGTDGGRGLQTTNEHEFTRIKAEAIYKKLVFIGVYSWLMQKPPRY